jgi:hypothetical protein
LGLGLVQALASSPDALAAASDTLPLASIEATHVKLRQLKDDAVAAIHAGQYELILPLLHSNIVVTAESSEVVRTRNEVEMFYTRLLTGSDRVLTHFEIKELVVDELSILHGDSTAVAFGSGRFDYQFVRGPGFQLPSRWTAVLVREQGRWVLAAFHNSVNVADNPVLDLARRTGYALGAGGILLGVLIGALSTRFLMRRKE